MTDGLINKPKNYTDLWLFLTFLALLIAASYAGYTCKDLKPTVIIYKDTCYCKTDSLTLSNLWKEISKQDIIFPEIVLKQAIIETGWFTSNICKNNNNLFGFYYNKQYLSFKSWKDCVTYYKKWQARKYCGERNYFTFLKKVGYAEDSTYCSKLQQLQINVDILY